MSERGWTVFCSEDAANVMEAMRAGGETELHDQVVLFLRALAIEAGAAADAGKSLPGLPMGDGRYNVDVPGLPILISYIRYPGLREFRITDLLWLGGPTALRSDPRQGKCRGSLHVEPTTEPTPPNDAANHARYPAFPFGYFPDYSPEALPC